jgi:mannose-6-phosphate isomerase-like protein (cupin superfamily)
MATTGRSPRRATRSLSRTIENPVTGDRTTFLATAEETNGELLKYRSEVPAGSPGVPFHYHLAFTERFEVLEGRLDIRLGERENHVVLEPGQSAFVPLDTPHRFWNGSAEPVVFVTEIRPARKMEQSLRAEYGLARDGKTNEKGVPTNIFELALLYALSESYLVGMPQFLQEGVFGALARIARWRGYDPEFSEYTKPNGLVGRRRPPSRTSLGTLTALTAMLALFLLLLWRRGHRKRTR